MGGGLIGGHAKSKPGEIGGGNHGGRGFGGKFFFYLFIGMVDQIGGRGKRGGGKLISRYGQVSPGPVRGGRLLARYGQVSPGPVRGGRLLARYGIQSLPGQISGGGEKSKPGRIGGGRGKRGGGKLLSRFTIHGGGICCLGGFPGLGLGLGTGKLVFFVGRHLILRIGERLH